MIEKQEFLVEYVMCDIDRKGVLFLVIISRLIIVILFDLFALVTMLRNIWFLSCSSVSVHSFVTPSPRIIWGLFLLELLFAVYNLVDIAFDNNHAPCTV